MYWLIIFICFIYIGLNNDFFGGWFGLGMIIRGKDYIMISWYVFDLLCFLLGFINY